MRVMGGCGPRTRPALPSGETSKTMRDDFLPSNAIHSARCKVNDPRNTQKPGKQIVALPVVEVCSGNNSKETTRIQKTVRK